MGSCQARRKKPSKPSERRRTGTGKIDQKLEADFSLKIGSKAIAKRLEKVLPYVIHHDQNAFVKGRTIFDAVGAVGE